MWCDSLALDHALWQGSRVGDVVNINRVCVTIDQLSSVCMCYNRET